MRPGFEVYGETRLWHDAVALWIHRVAGGRRHVVQPTQFIVVSEEPDVGRVTEASLELDRTTATNLMTELWRLGYRPVGANLSGGGELEATRAHLEDLRRLVFKLDPEPRAPTVIPFHAGVIVDSQALKRALDAETPGRFAP